MRSNVLVAGLVYTGLVLCGATATGTLITVGPFDHAMSVPADAGVSVLACKATQRCTYAMQTGGSERAGEIATALTIDCTFDILRDGGAPLVTRSNIGLVDRSVGQRAAMRVQLPALTERDIPAMWLALWGDLYADRTLHPTPWESKPLTSHLSP